MTDLYWRLLAVLSRLAGGRPDVVVPLARALDRSARGKADLLRQQSQRKKRMSTENVRLIILVIAALGSVILALVMLINPSDTHPPPGVIALVAAHWFFVGNLVLGQAGPSLLSDDDARTLGWWPVTRRELLLARLAILLKPALELTAAMCTAPLVTYAFIGKPVVVAAIVFAVGMLLQALGMAGGVAVLLALIVRFFGRRRAERLAGIVADGNGMAFPFIFVGAIDDILPWIKARMWVLYLLPPVWFVAWGDLAAGRQYWILAGLGLISTLLLFGFGLRLAIPSRTIEKAEPRRSRRSRFDLAGLVAAALSPCLTGREGWVVRRLLAAHLRDDWRFVGSVLTVPFLLIVFAFFLNHEPLFDPTPELLAHSALASVNLVMFMLFGGFILLSATCYSNQPEPLWQVALADLDSDRLMTAARRMVMILAGGPVAVIYVIKALSIGAPWYVALLDSVVIYVQLELLVLLMQPALLSMPFGSRYERDQSFRRILFSLVIMGLGVVFLVLDLAYAHFQVVRLATWIGLPVAWLLARRRLRRATAGVRLKMDVVIDA